MLKLPSISYGWNRYKNSSIYIQVCGLKHPVSPHYSTNDILLLHCFFLFLEKTNWKQQNLPLARIKKIMKSDEVVYADMEKDNNIGGEDLPVPHNPRFMIAGEAPILLGKACEMLVKELTIRAWKHTERNRRRTLQKQDIHAAVGESEVYDFLIDIVPRVQVQSSVKGFVPPIPTVPEVQHFNGEPPSVVVNEIPTLVGMSSSQMQPQYNYVVQQSHQETNPFVQDSMIMQPVTNHVQTSRQQNFSQVQHFQHHTSDNTLQQITDIS